MAAAGSANINDNKKISATKFKRNNPAPPKKSQFFKSKYLQQNDRQGSATQPKIGGGIYDSKDAEIDDQEFVDSEDDQQDEEFKESNPVIGGSQKP